MNYSARIILLIAALICCTGSLYGQTEKVRLIIDPKIGIDVHLHNFRKAQDRFIIPAETEPSREGLSLVRVSGSAQFSEGGLRRIMQRLSGERFIIVDLREESHGFANGIPVSWKGEHNGANRGKSLDEITADEEERLAGLLSRRTVSVIRILKKDDDERDMEEQMVVKTARTEAEVCKAAAVSYLRIPVTDHHRPSDRTVDDFIKFYKSRPHGIWLHFHCLAGKGRTTTFMVMCDMMHNAKKVTAEDIVMRHSLMGGRNIFRQESPESWKDSTNSERAQFIRKFYEYCRCNADGYRTGWLTWLSNKEKEKERQRLIQLKKEQKIREQQLKREKELQKQN